MCPKIQKLFERCEWLDWSSIAQNTSNTNCLDTKTQEIQTYGRTQKQNKSRFSLSSDHSCNAREIERHTQHLMVTRVMIISILLSSFFRELKVRVHALLHTHTLYV